ncbi:MAG: thioredoxin domain-containing protein [Candidatus Aquicultor sp.]
MLFPQPQPGEEIPKFRFSPKPNRAAEIHWNEWTPDAFNTAREDKKPILLAISAVWCHWCHIMDETSYSDEAVITFINDNYIPIRVDADKRPDIQNRYLLGGWPTTAILNDRGEILTGGTYMPPGELLRVLETVSDYYRDNYERLENESLEKQNQIKVVQSKPAPGPSRIDRKLADEILRAMNSSFDSVYGGFGQAPKFPQPWAVEFLLRRAFLEDDTYLLEMATTTLDHMAESEIMDTAWGGFFRYATERDWSKPHYEKLLSDNAGLILNYLHAYQVADFINYREIAEKTLDYVDEFLADKENGGFFGSQDADETFYRLSPNERTKAAMPFVDPVIYTDANAFMVSAYIEAFNVLDMRDRLDFAVKTIDFLTAKCYLHDQGMAHYYDGEAHFFGWLADQVSMIGALIDVYGATGNRSYLDMAKSLVSICEKRFRAENGTFFDRASDTEPQLGALFIKNTPVLENSLLARSLYRLAYIDESDRYEKMAEDILANLDMDTSASTPLLAVYGLAIDEVTVQPVVITVIANKDDLPARTLLREVRGTYIPGKETRLLDPVNDYETIEKSGFPPERNPVVYPCIGRMCLPPVTTAHEFKQICGDLPGRTR